VACERVKPTYMQRGASEIQTADNHNSVYRLLGRNLHLVSKSKTSVKGSDIFTKVYLMLNWEVSCQKDLR